MNDGELASAHSQITIQINPINDAPMVFPLQASTRLDQSITVFPVAEDIDSEQLSFRILSEPQNGSAQVNPDNSVTYTPTPGALAMDSFEIEVSDQLLTATTIISIDNDLSFTGTVNIDSLDDVTVILTSTEQLQTAVPDADGRFKFYQLADGKYSIKARKMGFQSAPAIALILDIAQLNSEPQQKVSQSSGQTENNAQSGSAQSIVLELVPVISNGFTFHWEEDQSTAGFDYAANINQPLVVEFLDEQIEVIDDASANHLQHDYNILLVDSESGSWTQEHAYRLLETLKTIPQEKRDSYAAQSRPASKWLLTNDELQNDVQITLEETNKTVLISQSAFANASPKLVRIDGKKGVYYSQRLHHALVRYVTDNGLDEEAYEKILQERFGLTTRIPDYETVTAPTTAENAGRFQSFHAEEIIQLINMFEEMPKGMHKLPELQYLLRRLDGTPHPLYSEAPAVAWAGNGYIEFMESGFNSSSIGYIHRLIIHEKSHFLWANQFEQQLKDDWIVLGGWYQEAQSDSGWSTTKQTEFVSAYAHLKNPNEDMAESMAAFLINPDLLKSRAIGKYEFIRDYIMQGNIYISQIDEDLTFQVYNLFPDYVFPGKINRVDISVDGEPEEDKTVTIEIGLHALDDQLEGASSAYLRILSEIGTFTDLYLSPVDEFGNPLAGGELSTNLQGSFTLSKYAKSGFWRTEQIIISDAVGNQRMEGANDFGWKLYIDNPLEDINPPQYVSATASLTKSVTSVEGQQVQIIHAQWQVDEATAMADSNACFATLNDEIAQTYSVQQWGDFSLVDEKCQVDFIMPHYMPSSNYSMNFIKMVDLALNQQGVYFTDPGHGLREEESIIDELPQSIELLTDNPDTETPELDLNNISIDAQPTNPEAPNGETIVTITFKVRDNISGYNIATLLLRDPQGIEHHFWAYNDDTWSLFPDGDPSVWQTYNRTIILPVGSAPGIWGMSELTVYDRAGNFNLYDFTELVHFDVIE